MINSSCAKKQLSKEEIINYINEPENGLCFTESHNGINYKITYKPTQLLFDSDSGEAEKEKSSHPSYLYLTMKIDKNSNSVNRSKSIEQVLFSRLSFNLSDYVMLTNDKGDTLSLIDYNSPRYFGFNKETEVLMAFDPYKEGDKEVIFHLASLLSGENEKTVRIKIEDIQELNSKIN